MPTSEALQKSEETASNIKIPGINAASSNGISTNLGTTSA